MRVRIEIHRVELKRVLRLVARRSAIVEGGDLAGESAAKNDNMPLVEAPDPLRVGTFDERGTGDEHAFTRPVEHEVHGAYAGLTRDEEKHRDNVGSDFCTRL
jgi:hypothetical protein